MLWMESLQNKECFSRTELSEAFKEAGNYISEPMLKKKLSWLLDSGQVVRVGRNAYCIPQNGERIYDYQYSELATEVADIVQEKHPFLKFGITELIQVNEFVNHQISHNVVFLSVEEDLSDFVFDTVKEKYAGKVLLKPSVDFYHQYRYDDMIVVQKLTTEAPKNKLHAWHARIEKLLVDVLIESLWSESIGESEFPTIYEEAFLKYVVDESCLFRYADRRNAEKKIRKFITDKTTVNLKLKR